MNSLLAIPMALPFALPGGDQLTQIGLFLLALVVIWIILRFVLRLAMRIFTLGCLLILGLGAALFILRFLAAK